MIISIDIDHTWDRDKELWTMFIRAAQSRGHIVVSVTQRSAWERWDIEDLAEILGGWDQIFFTEGLGKIEYMEKIPYHIDIWIDDCPACISGGGKWMWKEK